MKLSVVMACRNEQERIGAQLEALAGQSWDGRWELVVADNGSTDGSMRIVESYRARLQELRIVDASGRPGQPYAMNAGARAATGESVVFCDADDVVAPGWLAAIGDALARYDFVASRHDAEKLNPKWLVKGRRASQRDGLQRLWYPPYLPHAGGCGLGIRRSLLLQAGGFDEELVHLHDTDLCLRLQRLGVELRFVPGATIHIRFRADQRAVFRQAYSWARANSLVYKLNRPRGATLQRPWGRYLAAWTRLLPLIPRVRSKGVRTRFIWQVGWQLGLLAGALRYRVSPVTYVEDGQAKAGTVRLVAAR